MLAHFIHWLGATPASLVIQKVSWIIPTVQTIHILAISLVVASMAMFDLRLMGLAGTANSIAALSERFMPWLWSALAILLVSGAILIVGEPQRSLDNGAFQLKMGLLTTAIVITASFQVLLKRDLARGASDLAPAHHLAAKLTGALSLLLWVGIILAGRLIAYTS